MGRTVTILGATGLIGSHLLRILINDPKTDRIVALVRNTADINNPKLEQFVIDFEDPKAYEPHIAGAEVVFSAVGTTNKDVDGDHEKYKKVDFDINRYAATAAARLGVYSYVLVSAAKADPNNNNSFYLKLKGVTEEVVCQQTIPQIHIMRPSVLIGRKTEKRPGEVIVETLSPLFSWAFKGKNEALKPIPAEEVAKAMFAASFSPAKGIHFHEYDSMHKLIKTLSH
jgi:uncharacterized protein YbjT (DUF2867 family)